MKSFGILLIFAIFLIGYPMICLSSAESEFCNCEKFRLRVCGVDATTYLNICELKCARVKFDHHGYCKCGCKDDEKDLPVCGDDMVTYANMCEFNCSKKSFQGELKEVPCKRTKIEDKKP